MGIEQITVDGEFWTQQISPYYSYTFKQYTYNNDIIYLSLGTDNLYHWDSNNGTNTKLDILPCKAWVTDIAIYQNHFYLATMNNGLWRIDKPVTEFKGIEYSAGKKDEFFSELVEMIDEK